MADQTVLCIGLDAACFEQISPLIETGDLPTIEALIDRGTSGRLTSTTPPWTPSAWQSVTTGTTPWKHGIYDFYDYTGSEPHLVSATDLRVPYLWEYFDQAGLGSIVINVPVTHPIHQFSGTLVPGYLAPENGDIVVDGEPTTTAVINDDYRIYARETDSRAGAIAENEALIDSRVTAAEAVADRHDWSFMMVQFQRTDSIFHTMGHDTEAVRRVYSAVDDAIDSLLELVDDDTTVLVVSDHGIHQYERTFRCNRWLQTEGWLQSSTSSERTSWGETAKPTEEEATDDETASRRLIGAAFTALQRLGITPQRAERALSFVGLADPVRRRLPDALILDSIAHVDWTASEAYCRSVSSLGIRCNVAGREPDGVVPASEFERVRSELVDSLGQLRSPDGKAVFEDVYDRHERHGADVANEASAPDIVLRPAEMRWKITDVIREPVFDTTDEFSHKYEGLFIAAGPDVNSAAETDMHVIDIAPTIMELFGYRPGTVMQGEPPEALLQTAAEELVAPPTPGERNYLRDAPTESSDLVTKRLENLGYLE